MSTDYQTGLIVPNSSWNCGEFYSVYISNTFSRAKIISRGEFDPISKRSTQWFTDIWSCWKIFKAGKLFSLTVENLGGMMKG